MFTPETLEMASAVEKMPVHVFDLFDKTQEDIQARERQQTMQNARREELLRDLDIRDLSDQDRKEKLRELAHLDRLRARNTMRFHRDITICRVLSALGIHSQNRTKSLAEIGPLLAIPAVGAALKGRTRESINDTIKIIIDDLTSRSMIALRITMGYLQFPTDVAALESLRRKYTAQDTSTEKS